NRESGGGRRHHRAARNGGSPVGGRTGLCNHHMSRRRVADPGRANVTLVTVCAPQAEIALADCTSWRSRNFWILPVEVFGIAPNTTAFGVLKPDMWLLQ